MGAGHRAKFLGSAEADKPTKVRQVILIGAAGARVVEVGEPFRRGRHAGQLLELGGAQATFTGAVGHQLAQRMSGPAGRPAACSLATHSQYSRIERSASDSGTKFRQRSDSSSISAWESN